TEQIDGVPCFTVRSPGAFVQEVALPPAAAGMYAVIVGGQTGRVNAGPSITGLPYLYGLVIGTDRAGNLRRDRGVSRRYHRLTLWWAVSFAAVSVVAGLVLQLLQR